MTSPVDIVEHVVDVLEDASWTVLTFRQIDEDLTDLPCVGVYVLSELTELYLAGGLAVGGVRRQLTLDVVVAMLLDTDEGDLVILEKAAAVRDLIAPPWRTDSRGRVVIKDCYVELTAPSLTLEMIEPESNLAIAHVEVVATYEVRK